MDAELAESDNAWRLYDRGLMCVRETTAGRRLAFATSPLGLLPSWCVQILACEGVPSPAAVLTYVRACMCAHARCSSWVTSGPWADTSCPRCSQIQEFECVCVCVLSQANLETRACVGRQFARACLVKCLSTRAMGEWSRQIARLLRRLLSPQSELINHRDPVFDLAAGRD